MPAPKQHLSHPTPPKCSSQTTNQVKSSGTMQTIINTTEALEENHM